MRKSSIYFVINRNLGAVKIGVSRDVQARLATLQTASPVKLELLATIEGDANDERRLHDYFKSSRLSGEWFVAGSTGGVEAYAGCIEVLRDEGALLEAAFKLPHLAEDLAFVAYLKFSHDASASILADPTGVSPTVVAHIRDQYTQRKRVA